MELLLHFQVFLPSHFNLPLQVIIELLQLVIFGLDIFDIGLFLIA
jgi:hypothetical protein